MSQNGKGDTLRKRSVSYQEFAENWDSIFGKKEVKQTPEETGEVKELVNNKFISTE